MFLMHIRKFLDILPATGVFISLTLIPGLLMSQTLPPVVFYSDLDSGPGSGGPSGGGAIVNVYGKGFGASQGSSFVSIGGAQALAYLQWSDTNVAFQLGGSAATGNLTVTTPNGTSNGVPFTVRAGNIYFVSTSGNDNNAGSYSAPWATLLHARDSMQPGDITYALNGVSQTTDDDSGWNACLTLDGSAGQSGTAGLPMAMVAYPGATATIGNVNFTAGGGCDSGIRAKGNGENYWTFAGFVLRGGVQAMNPYSEVGWRIIANDMSCPNGNDETGCLDIQFGVTTYAYGNTIHDVATNLSPGSVTALYQGVYISGHNTGLQFGWNTVERVQGCRGIQQNVNSGEGGSSYDLHIHDNVIHDTQCDGIVMTTVNPAQGTVELYNNLIYNAGTGPNNSDGTGDWSCMYLGGWSFATESGTIQVYNNTMFNCGTFANPPYSGSNAGFQWDSGGNPNKSVQLTDNIIYAASGVPYLLIFEGTSETQCSGNCSAVTGTNNLFYNNGAPPADSYLTATVNANPLFVSTTIPDFHLQAGSPAANGGATTPDVRDFDGVPLPQGSAYPIGAYAYPLGVTSPTYTLTLLVSPSGAGTLTANPSGGTYASGTQVCLTETPNAGWAFSSWSGATVNSSNCLIVTTTTTVTANFVSSAPASANSRSFVSAAGNDANNCTVSAPCGTLTRALAMTNGGGEIIVLDSGAYAQATITQPVTISANGVAASIDAGSGNGLTIDTPGNVTIQGLELHGQGTGNDGVLVQQVGILRLYNLTAEDFANDGVEMASAGNLAIYNSRFTDNQNGLAVLNSSVNAYVHHTSFDHNGNAGVYVPQGVAAAEGASAHFNGTGFEASGGTLVLARDRTALNSTGVSAVGASAVGRFASCSVALNTLYSYSASSGGTLAGTNPGSNVLPGAGSGSLGSPTVLH
jgi:hypothetical protein